MAPHSKDLPVLNTILIAFFASAITTLMVVRYQHLHGHFTSDHDLIGVQKFHAKPVPRVGGIGVFFGCLFSVLLAIFEGSRYATFGSLLILAALPAFIMGLAEDLTKQVSVSKRLLATMVSAALGGYLLGGWLTRIDIAAFDSVLAYGFISVVVTCFAVAGVANAFNIIDGYNGLAGMVAVIILSGLCYVAYQVEDRAIMMAALSLIGGVLGFLIWNYPGGHVFLGDGGAYLIGFMVAELSVLLVARNSQVSPWFPLLLSFYPIFETVFTVFRRVIIGRTHPGLPDAAHLHQLIYRRIVCWPPRDGCLKRKTLRNSMTSPYLWVVASFAAVPAVLFWRDSILLALICTVFASFYIGLYLIIYKSKFPNWLSIREKK